MKTQISHQLFSFIVAIAMMLFFSSRPLQSQEVTPTRGIGLYPGDPSEYFGPSTYFYPSEDSCFLPNVARLRAAWASSTRDYNHTAHLVTRPVETANKLLSSIWDLRLLEFVVMLTALQMAVWGLLLLLRAAPSRNGG